MNISARGVQTLLYNITEWLRRASQISRPCTRGDLNMSILLIDQFMKRYCANEMTIN